LSFGKVVDCNAVTLLIPFDNGKHSVKDIPSEAALPNRVARVIRRQEAHDRLAKE
jgi:porphobilinogen deaminase